MIGVRRDARHIVRVVGQRRNDAEHAHSMVDVGRIVQRCAGSETRKIIALGQLRRAVRQVPADVRVVDIHSAIQCRYVDRRAVEGEVDANPVQKLPSIINF